MPIFNYMKKSYVSNRFPMRRAFRGKPTGGMGATITKRRDEYMTLNLPINKEVRPFALTPKEVIEFKAMVQALGMDIGKFIAGTIKAKLKEFRKDKTEPRLL